MYYDVYARPLLHKAVADPANHYGCFDDIEDAKRACRVVADFCDDAIACDELGRTVWIWSLDDRANW